ncbi:MAG: HlyC/CorC family transporter [Candidatus Dadabacteria bacterium]|nr:MAG: HlyC/CorC family transporter [Candidatus Dadabacteria bacterium]
MIWAIVILILLNGYFVAAEFALVRLQSAPTHRFQDDPSLRGRIVRRMLAHLDMYLSTAQLGITFTSIALGSFGEPYLSALLERGLAQWVPGVERLGPAFIVALSLSFITTIQIIVGEQGPKSFGIRAYERVVSATAIPMHLMYVVFWVPIQLINFGSLIVVRMLGGDPSAHRTILTEDELRLLLRQGHSHGSISERERKIMTNAMRLEELEAREVMVPRPDVVTIDVSATIQDARRIVRESGHSRVPIVDPDLDHCVGLLYAKDLLRDELDEQASVATLAREAIYVPETMNAEKLLYLFQTRGLHIAIVIDEFGGASGIVTLEDILEELVGEINDEYDRVEPQPVRRLAPDRWRAVGMAKLSELEELLDVEFDTEEDTLNGWFIDEKNDFPRRGDALMLGPWRFTVEAVDGHRIASVLIERVEESEGDEAESAD